MPILDKDTPPPKEPRELAKAPQDYRPRRAPAGNMLPDDPLDPVDLIRLTMATMSDDEWYHFAQSLRPPVRLVGHHAMITWLRMWAINQGPGQLPSLLESAPANEG